MHRAVHQALDQPPVFLDPFAGRIIGPRARAVLATHPRKYERSWYASYLRALLAVRSRIAEDTLADCVSNGVHQYVVLGAGLDTFGLRNSYPALRVFEVDHPQTQTWKRRLLAEEALGEPASLCFVPVNFEHEPWERGLLAAGLDPAQPTFFSWLGVTPYLEGSVIRTTLETIARLAGNTGGVVFDFITRPPSRALFLRLLLWLRAQSVARLGEPFRSYLDPVIVEADLKRLGFGDVKVFSPPELNARYFENRADRLRIGDVSYVARAIGIGIGER
jgi:methyltransferase (TIGR00027 family)